MHQHESINAPNVRNRYQCREAKLLKNISNMLRSVEYYALARRFHWKAHISDYLIHSTFLSLRHANPTGSIFTKVMTVTATGIVYNILFLYALWFFQQLEHFLRHSCTLDKQILVQTFLYLFLIFLMQTLIFNLDFEIQIIIVFECIDENQQLLIMQHTLHTCFLNELFILVSCETINQFLTIHMQISKRFLVEIEVS